MKRLSLLITIIFFALIICSCSEQSSEYDYAYTDEPDEYEITEETTDTEDLETTQENPNINSDYASDARQYLQSISEDIGDREPGSEGETQTAEYIFDVFESNGYSPKIQEFSFEDAEDETSLQSSNVIAVKQGQSDQVIVVGAHYDAGYEDGTDGADDNASGVAAMLETAALIFTINTPYTIEFIAFGAEENNIDGSTYFVDNLSSNDLKNIIGMVNLDSIIAGDKLYIYGNEGSGTMRDWLLEDADSLGIQIEGKTDEQLYNSDGSYCECSDFDAFEKESIPYVFFEATNWDLSPDAMIQVDPQYGVDGEIRHTQYDTISYIDENFPNRIDEHLGTVVTLLYDLLTQYE